MIDLLVAGGVARENIVGRNDVFTWIDDGEGAARVTITEHQPPACRGRGDG